MRPQAERLPYMKQPEIPPETLNALQRETFDYFVHEANPLNGLVVDKTQEGCTRQYRCRGIGPFGLPGRRGTLLHHPRRRPSNERSPPCGFSVTAPKAGAEATGYKGFYYHFLDMKTGRRVWKCELSTVDTAFLLAGMLTAAAYFADEYGGRARNPYAGRRTVRRADWQWAQDGGATVTHGWKPESGFLPYRWQGYDEALLLYVLGLGSPTHPLPEESYAAWTSTYSGGRSTTTSCCMPARSLPISSPTCGLIFVESKTRTCAARASIILKTAAGRLTCSSNTPSTIRGQFDGLWRKLLGDHGQRRPRLGDAAHQRKERRLLRLVRGACPMAPTMARSRPWAVVASLPFAPEIVLPALQYFDDLKLRVTNTYGYKATFNPTFPREPTGRRAGCRPGTSASTRGRSC